MITAEDARKIQNSGRIKYLTNQFIEEIEKDIEYRAAQGWNNAFFEWSIYNIDRAKCVQGIINEFESRGFSINRNNENKESVSNRGIIEISW